MGRDYYPIRSPHPPWSVAYAMKCQERDARHEAIEQWCKATGKEHAIWRFVALEMIRKFKRRQQ